MSVNLFRMNYKAARMDKNQEGRQCDGFRSRQKLRRQQRNSQWQLGRFDFSELETGKWHEHSPSLDAASCALFI
jgi:hypothetical protein